MKKSRFQAISHSPLAFTLPLFGSLLLSSCSGGSSSSGGGGTVPIATQTTPYIYTSATDATGDVILSYPVAATGTVAATTKLSAATGMRIVSLRNDAAGSVYVLYAPSDPKSLAISVSTFSASNGSLTPKRTFTSTLSSPAAASMAIDKSGNVLVGQTDGTISTFAATASGTVLPSSTFKAGTGYIGSLVFSTSGNLFVNISDQAKVLEFAAGLASSIPVRTIDLLSYFAANGGGTGDMVTDTAGNLYVLVDLSNAGALYGSILIYSTGATSATRTITGESTQLVSPSSMAIDSAGTLYVEDWISSSNHMRAYETYASLASGNIAPLSRFTATDTNTAVPARIVVQ